MRNGYLALRVVPLSLRLLKTALVTCLILVAPLQSRAADMVLNGVAMHSEFKADMFWAGLYLPTYSSNADEVFTMRGQKRMEMRIVAESFSPRKFAGLWRDSIVINNNPADVEKFGPEMLKFAGLMKGKLVTGDQITIDSSVQATVVAVNGNEIGRFPADFFPVLLRTWIGPRPASSDFKKDLLLKGNIPDVARGKYNTVVPLDGRNQLATIWAASPAGGGDAAARAAEDARIQAEAEAAKARAEAEAQAQAEAKARAEAEARAQAEAKARAEAEARAQAEAKARAEAQAKAQADAKARAEAQAKAQAEARVRAETEAKAQAEALKAAEEARLAALKASSDAQAKAQAAEQARLRAEAEAKARAEAEAKARAEAEAETKAQAEAIARAEAEAKAQAEAIARAEAEAKAQAEAKTRAEAAAKAKAEAESRALAASKAAEEARQRAATEAAAKTQVAASTPAADDENAAVVFDAAQAARELYASKLVSWAYKSLEYPERDKARRNEGELKVKITINRDGRVQGDVELLEQSRYASLNLAAKNGVKAAQPYPPIPANIPGDSFEFTVPVLFRVD